MFLLIQLICLISVNFIHVHSAYFSIADVELNIPGNRSKYPPGNHVLATLQALPDKDEGKTSHFRYTLIDNKEKHLQIFHGSGDIMFTKKFLKEITDISNITVHVSVEDGSGAKDNTTFRVNISPMNGPDCDFIATDLCYWQKANYRIFENRKASVLGTLGSPYLTDICGGFKINYTLTKGQDRVQLIPPTELNTAWVLSTIGPLERDVLKTTKSENHFHPDFGNSGQNIKANIICHVLDPKGTSREIPKEVTIWVMDVNDNLPILQEAGLTNLHIELNSTYVTKGQTVQNRKLMFIDRDSQHVNGHRFEILNDSLRLLRPNCTSFEDDTHGEEQTVLYCKLIFVKNAQIPHTPYTVILQINDTTPASGDTVNWIRIPIHLHTPNAVTVPHALGLTVPPTPSPKPLILYEHRELFVFRSAGPFARIAQPIKSINKTPHNFTLLSDSTHNGAFNITASEGIIYVQNILQLRKSPAEVRLTVQWMDQNKSNSDELLLNVKEEPSHTCTNISTNINAWAHCSEYGKYNDCVKACSVATGGSVSVKNRKTGLKNRCMWRGDTKPTSGLETHLYATCTPDVDYCPDGVCDSHEELHLKICPQDCISRAQVTFPTSVNSKTGKGIVSAIGVCTCDNTGMCVCGKRTGNKKRTNASTLEVIQINSTIASSPPPNLSRHTGPEKASCGKTCLLGILAGGLFLLGAMAAAVACWRFNRIHKVRGKFSEDSNDLSAPLSEYVDRAIVPENTLTLNFDMTTSLSQRNHDKPDPKWEFPRSQLIIEQTLGEGEFGRVLRARAKDIAGQPGYTIVAVKTLKEDARETELEDLLSEYQLLKEVSHPNIIRLLGASTLPGGPVYLIIEFAQYGSLRSYLRRSRHLKSESRPPFSARLEEATKNDNYDEPRHCKVSSTDILSFAWQISNGMSYLSDIKLVHRDLAARNILLTSEMLCKISDFGLTRDIYEEDAYFKRSKGRVPVKWMAPESLSDHVYTNKSDVWSFGILIWELVTLGATPYPGIQVQNLFHLLKSGYRMERPDNCSLALYKIMRSCWHIEPEQRPNFKHLTSKWENMLSDQVEYLDLTPNAIHNRSYFCTFDDDEDDENDNSDNSKNIDHQENLENNLDNAKCGDADKLLDPKPDNLANSLQTSPINAPGYETPVKIKQKVERPTTPTNEDPQYYTNMDAARSK